MAVAEVSRDAFLGLGAGESLGILKASASQRSWGFFHVFDLVQTKHTNILLIYMNTAFTMVGRFKFASTTSWQKDYREIAVQVPNSSRVSGDSCTYSFLFIPLTRAKITTTYEEALKNAPKAQALADVEVKDVTKFVTLFFNASCYRVIGLPVTFKKVAQK